MRLTLSCAFALLAVPVTAQTIPELIHLPALGENIDATPRLALTTPMAEKINGSLQMFDTSSYEALAACDGPARDVRTLSRSAEFLSLWVTESAICEGAAHPYYGDWLVSFDLSTGGTVFWDTLLPESLLQTKAADYDPNYPLRSAALNALYRAQAPKNAECAEVFANPVDFNFAIDAANHALAMVPVGLPYAEIACAETALIPLDLARTLDLSPRLLTAIETGQP